MKKVFAVLLPLTLCAAAAFANDLDDSSIGRWNSIAGVITAAGVENPVGASTPERVPGPSEAGGPE